jgi:ABC-type glycerol-3-phosphate transport system permease component
MKPNIQKNIGEITAWIVFVIAVIIGLYKITFYYSNKDQATHSPTFPDAVDKETGLVPTPKEKSIGSCFEIAGFLSTLILSAVFAFCLHKKNLRGAKTTYRIWWIALLIPLCLLLLSLLLLCKNIEGYFTLLVVLILSYLPFGLITFLYWVGLKGLLKMESMSANTIEPESDKSFL